MKNKLAKLLANLGGLGNIKLEKNDIIAGIDTSMERVLVGLCMLESGVYEPDNDEMIHEVKPTVSHLIGGLLHRLMVHKYGHEKMASFKEGDCHNKAGYEKLRLLACRTELENSIDEYYNDHFCKSCYLAIASGLLELGCSNKQTPYKYRNLELWVDGNGDVTIEGDSRFEIVCAIHGEKPVYERLVKVGCVNKETAFEYSGISGWANTETGKVEQDQQKHDGVVSMEDLIRTFEGEEPSVVEASVSTK